MSDLVKDVAQGALIGGFWGAVVGAGVWLYNTYNEPPKPRRGTEPLPPLNAVSSDDPLPVYYGFSLVDPIIVFRDARSLYLDSSGFAAVPSTLAALGNHATWAFVVAVIGEGEIEAVDAVLLDGKLISDPALADSVRFEWHGGTDNQFPSQTLNATLQKFGPTDVGKGVAYMVLALKVNTLAYPGREPRIQLAIRGRKLKDPRDGVTRFSPNPALAIRDYWTNTRYGRRVAEAKIVDTEINTEANYFEERVAIPVISVAFTADPATDQVTLASATLLTGSQVILTTTGALPAGLALATIYFWIAVSATIGRLATTLANAQAGTSIDITSAGTGANTITTTAAFDVAQVYPLSVTDFRFGLNQLVFSQDVPFDRGDGVRLSTTGVLPTGLNAGVTYYWIPGFAGRAPGFTSNVAMFSTPAGVTMARAGRLASSYANAMANVEVLVTDSGTGTMTVTHIDQPRYTCNGRLDPSANPLDNLSALRSSCRSWFFESSGLYHLVADKVTAGSFDFTPDNMVGKWNIDMGDPDTHYNRMEAHFFNSILGDQDVAISDNATELAADGRLMIGSMQLDFTSNYYIAQRLAQMARRASRIGMRVALTGHVQGFEVLCGQVVRITHPDPGFVNKLFRIARINLADNEEYPTELAEYADSVFTMDALAPTVLPPRTNLTFQLNPLQQVPPNVSGLELFTS